MTNWKESVNKQLFDDFIGATVILIRSLSGPALGNGRGKLRVKCQDLNSFFIRCCWPEWTRNVAIPMWENGRAVKSAPEWTQSFISHDDRQHFNAIQKVLLKTSFHRSSPKPNWRLWLWIIGLVDKLEGTTEYLQTRPLKRRNPSSFYIDAPNSFLQKLEVDQLIFPRVDLRDGIHMWHHKTGWRISTLAE
jgi:hypothetical protein